MSLGRSVAAGGRAGVTSRWWLPSAGFLIVFGVGLSGWRLSPNDEPVRVRFPEGALHGFLVLRTVDGNELAYGNQLVTPGDGMVESRIVFRFFDGSSHDERVAFTQDSVFRMRRYTLTQSGPAFPADVEIELDGRSGAYRVAHHPADGEREVHQDTLDLPADTYNGLVLSIAKNIPAGQVEEVHYVAFTPKPQLIGLELSAAGVDSFAMGTTSLATTRFVVKPRLGLVRQVFASLLGKDPPDNHVWLVTEPVPGFVGFEGPLYMPGPAWRIELAAPRRAPASQR